MHNQHYDCRKWFTHNIFWKCVVYGKPPTQHVLPPTQHMFESVLRMVNLQRFTIGIPYTTQFQHMRCVSHFLTIVQHAPCAQTATMYSMKYYSRNTISRKRDTISRKQYIISRKRYIISRKRYIISRKRDNISRKRDIISRKRDIISRKRDIISRKRDIISQIIHTRS